MLATWPSLKLCFIFSRLSEELGRNKNPNTKVTRYATVFGNCIIPDRCLPVVGGGDVFIIKRESIDCACEASLSPLLWRSQCLCFRLFFIFDPVAATTGNLLSAQLLRARLKGVSHFSIYQRISSLRKRNLYSLSMHNQWEEYKHMLHQYLTKNSWRGA